MGKIINLPRKSSDDHVDEEIIDDLTDLLKSIAHEETRRTVILDDDSEEKNNHADNIMSIEQFRPKK